MKKNLILRVNGTIREEVIIRLSLSGNFPAGRKVLVIPDDNGGLQLDESDRIEIQQEGQEFQTVTPEYCIALLEIF